MNDPRRSVLGGFLANEAAGGMVLMGVAVLAMAAANSPMAPLYFEVLHLPLGGLSLLHWINDGLMAVFFLLVGLEIKREVLDGELSTWRRRALPGIAAAAGMAAPALIYVAFQAGDPQTLRGWAIPAATDIAFALGVLALLGSRVPVSLKVFLTALAIIDDLGAVLIIAVFYTAGLTAWALAGAGLALAGLIALNRLRVRVLWPYLLVGAVLWAFMLKSGVHATLAGVMTALTVPLTASPGRPDDASSPLHRLEHALQPWVAFGILPVFGFANAGVSLVGVTAASLVAPVPLGVAAGLFLGKQAGVFAAAWLTVRLGWAELPSGASWRQLYGVSVLCGVGFTMSLFIGLLAFSSEALHDALKLGVLAGSLLSAITGWILLRTAPARPRPGDR